MDTNSINLIRSANMNDGKKGVHYYSCAKNISTLIREDQ